MTQPKISDKLLQAKYSEGFRDGFDKGSSFTRTETLTRPVLQELGKPRKATNWFVWVALANICCLSLGLASLFWGYVFLEQGFIWDIVFLVAAGLSLCCGLAILIGSVLTD